MASGFCERPTDILVVAMHYILRFLWNATRGHHLTPWRSPYLRWRIETYTGIKMQSIGFLEFLRIHLARAMGAVALSQMDRRDGEVCARQAEEPVKELGYFNASQSSIGVMGETISPTIFALFDI